MSAGKGTRDGERLDVLVTLIEACERKHFPMELFKFRNRELSEALIVTIVTAS